MKWFELIQEPGHSVEIDRLEKMCIKARVERLALVFRLAVTG